MRNGVAFQFLNKKDITVLDHVTYFARPPHILLYLMLRQFFIRVGLFYTQHTDKHIPRAKCPVV